MQNLLLDGWSFLSVCMNDDRADRMHRTNEYFLYHSIYLCCCCCCCCCSSGRWCWWQFPRPYEIQTTPRLNTMSTLLLVRSCFSYIVATSTITLKLWMLGPRHLIMNYRSARDDASTWIIWSSWICVGVSRREKRKSTRYVLRWGWFWWDVHFKCWIRIGKARWGNQEEGSVFKRAPCFHARYSWEENGREIFSSQSLKVPSISVCGWILL